MSYKIVDEKFWTDPELKAMTINDRFVFMYLITSPQAHYSGLYYLPVETIAFEIGLKAKEVSDSINTLSAKDFIRYDFKVSIVWVINMFKYQGHGNLQLTGAANHFKTLHATNLIIDCIEYYKKLDINIPYQYPIDTLSILPHTVSVSLPVSESVPIPVPVSTYIVVFDLWNHHCIVTHKKLTDKIKGKINARLDEGHTLEDILTAIDNYAEILLGQEYFFKYKWPLDDFLHRGFEKFKDLEIAKSNYRRKSNDFGKSKPAALESEAGKYTDLPGTIK